MKLSDALIGVAVGDAYGFGLEFSDRRWIRENVDFARFIDHRSEHKAPYKPGYYSDETEHTIGVLKALISTDNFSAELLLREWKAEYDTDKIAKGFGREGHGSIQDWYEGRLSIEKIRKRQAERDEPGNGPAGRAIPLGFVKPGDVGISAIINANATHPHPKARAASMLVARATEYLIVEHGAQQGLIQHCAGYITDTETKALLRQADALGPYETLDDCGFEVLCGPQPVRFFQDKETLFFGLPGTAMRTAVAALYITKHSQDAFSGLKNSILLGGDVDSLAAICTGLLAGRFGLQSLPTFMLEQTEGIGRLRNLAEIASKSLPFSRL